MLSDPLWTNEPAILFRENRLKEFWPTDKMSCSERVNAFTRFVIFLSAGLYAFTQRASYALLGLSVMGMIALVGSRVSDPELFVDYPYAHDASDRRFTQQRRCLMPTRDNPFGNVAVHELSDRSLPSCNYKDVVGETNRLATEAMGPGDAGLSRQFYQMPVTDSISDTNLFGRFLYGQGPTCKSDPSVCTGFDFGPKSNVPPL